jgi:hypothetical protein
MMCGMLRSSPWALLVFNFVPYDSAKQCAEENTWGATDQTYYPSHCGST